MLSESEDKEGKNGGQGRDDKGKGQAFQEPHKTQNFKRSSGSSSSYSGGLSTNMQKRGDRFTGGPRCNNRHLGECTRGSNRCFTCGQMGHRAAQCLHSRQRPQQPSFPPPAPTQYASGSRGYTKTGRGGTYHYQGDTAPYTSRQQQYSQDPQYQSGYPQYQGRSMSYQPYSVGRLKEKFCPS
ncbi:serine/arginine-rich splicing factor RSZ22-like [Malus domestica]|uniref:serine/arginine-rich splicing factor RSZ22-like n=1 Tax=Malus domestica TaxID=3750 RepID=UPI0039764810